ncbi:MAG: hypothetical protein L6R36_007142 [Xanthoria steineri]|nr:MAG: hypothetical protein L6R36_007142 [Xanthoria steineri]
MSLTGRLGLEQPKRVSTGLEPPSPPPFRLDHVTDAGCCPSPALAILPRAIPRPTNTAAVLLLRTGLQPHPLEHLTLPYALTSVGRARPLPSSDDDYADGSDDSVSNLSIASTIYQYRLENGRRYHAYRDGQYWAPNDQQARSSEMVSHHAFLITLNDRLLLAPIHKPRRALDVGCGIGTWTLDFAEAYPNTAVVGTDLSPIQPDTIPPNLHFEIDDCCSDWVYPRDHFDYIHVRQLYGSVADWPKFYRECYDHLAPGGYIEQAEVNPAPKSDDGSIARGDPFDECGKLAVRAGNAFGKSLMVEEFMHDEIVRAGFTDVVRVRFKWPIGGWSNDPRLKELGKWVLVHWNEGLEGWVLRFFTKHMGWTFEGVKQWNADMRRVLKDRKYHAYQDVSVVYARKPL